MKNNLELYIHIPFCVKKCAYCDFLSGPASQERIEKYVEALIGEIRTHKAGMHHENVNVTSIFFGGGTPSVLNGNQMQKIMNSVKDAFQIDINAEISMEANPGTVTKEKLMAYRSAGINRISFGLQSANNDELKLLGRIHTFEEFLESYRLARECGFENVNVDLISAIPEQTVHSWEKSLNRIMALAPEHISAYSLIIEEGTPFFELYGEGTAGEKDLPSEEEERVMYHHTDEILSNAGYHRYEISNYAKEGKECKHNLGYWDRQNYLGIGLGASSLINNVRFKNTDDLMFYLTHSKELEAIQEEKEVLSETEQMEEYVFLGLRKMQGISVGKFKEEFGKTLQECYGENIQRMIKESLLQEEEGFLRLTRKGIDISNYVFAEILG